MKISARNVLAGTVQSATKGAVNAEVTISLQGGETIVALITNSSVDSLGLAAGKPAFAIVKASDVMIAKGLEGIKLSARNLLPGTVANVLDGAVSSEVAVRLSGGSEVVASITKGSAHTLDLKSGDQVSVVVKSSHVLVGA